MLSSLQKIATTTSRLLSSEHRHMPPVQAVWIRLK